MTHTYSHRFFAECPNNGQVIAYLLEIETSRQIMVEHIVTACALHRRGYHEDIAANLFGRFGGVLTLTAHHHGVDIKTVCK
jgi:hypothetical protein